MVTEGILLRRLQQDPELAGVGLVIFDEFHERSLEGDFALALCLEVRAALRDDLRLLVMSATIDPAPVSRLLGNAPVVTCGTTLFPVTVVHCRLRPARTAAAATIWRPTSPRRSGTPARTAGRHPGLSPRGRGNPPDPGIADPAGPG